MVKNSHVVWGNWSINLLKPHPSCAFCKWNRFHFMSAWTVIRPALNVQGEMRVFPFPSVRKVGYYWWKQSRIPLFSLIWDQLFRRVQSTSCLWMCTPHSIHWLCSGSLVCAQQSQKSTTYDLPRQTLQREGISHVLVQVTGVHLFTVNLLKAQVMLSLNSWNRTQIFIQGSQKTLCIWPVLQIFKGVITQLFLVDALADFWTFCQCCCTFNASC